MRAVQNILSLNQILDLLHTSHLGMGTEIKTGISIRFFSFIRGGNALPQQKCSDLLFFLDEA